MSLALRVYMNCSVDLYMHTYGKYNILQDTIAHNLKPGVLSNENRVPTKRLPPTLCLASQLPNLPKPRERPIGLILLYM